MKTIHTKYPHNFDAFGKSIDCDGTMDLRALPKLPVTAVCSKCGQGWTLEYLSTPAKPGDVAAA